ncbi:MAG: ABC transporter permease subunit [Clostridia bacterium]|nr:ABC transporter permease subunit [Clostridia bacterium]
MNSFLVFTAKELREQLKTFKGVVVLVVLLIFGMTSPLLAKLTPEILKLAGAGVKIQIPTPTYIDAYAQFFKNIGQMVMIVVILVFSGGVVSETSKGTAQMMLTKRLSRSSFILSKFLSDACVWTISYAASAGLCICYTVYLFPTGNPAHLFLSLFCMWLFGIMTIAVSLLTSTVFNNYALSAVGAFCLWGLISLISSIPKITDYAPSALGGDNMGLISGSIAPAALRVPILTGVLISALLLLAACLLFRRREL